MWAVLVVMTYFVLALLAPIGWALGRTWYKARLPRRVACPVVYKPATVDMDAWFAARMHALGMPETRVRNCSLWPARANCSRECLADIARY
jgi:hypothetical protein